jgi:hypothetical protein
VALRKEQKIAIGFLVFGIPVLLGLVAGGKQAFGGKPGERCEDLSGCQFGNVCIGHRCYEKCTSDADCPSTSHCGTTNVTVTRQGTFGTDSQDSSERICFPRRTK